MRRTLTLLTVAALPLMTAGCSSIIDGAYFNMVENVTGKHKREIMVDRVAEARDAQKAAAEQFKTALETFREVVDFDGGDLQEKYNRINDAYERSSKRAEAVTERIDGIESVSDALFDEWEDELDQYSSESLRDRSQQQMEQTRDLYGELVAKMRQAESKMEPVLATLRDQTLYLKHNLNAAAIASLEDEVVILQNDVGALIADMEAAIAEADEFIGQLEAGTS